MREDMRLPDFKPDEKVLAVARKHWFVFAIQVVGLLILFVVPFFFIPFLSIFVSAGGGPVTIPSGFGFFFASLWALIIWQMLFSRWTDLYYDVWIITNWRIIDVDQKGFFHRDIATLLNLDHIEDITTVIDSVIGTLLDYGTLRVQTAAARPEFQMRFIDNPRRIEKIVRKAQEERLGINRARGGTV